MKTWTIILVLLLCTAAQGQTSNRAAEREALRVAMLTTPLSDPDSVDANRTAGGLLMESANSRKTGLFILTGCGLAGAILASGSNSQTASVGGVLMAVGGLGWLVFEFEAAGLQRRAGRKLKQKGL